MRQAVRHLPALAMLPTLLLLFLPDSAHADNVGPEQTGWWYAANQAPAPAPSPPAPPVAPEGGLYVAYSGTNNPAGIAVNAPINGTVAYSAVRYRVTPGSQGALVLKTAAGSSALTAQLQACRTTGSWTAVDGGKWYEQPGYDASSCSDGTIAADGSTATFAIPANFTTDGLVDVAVAPKPGATPFSVAFDEPASDSLSVTGGRTLPQSSTPPTLPGASSSPSASNPGPPAQRAETSPGTAAASPPGPATAAPAASASPTSSFPGTQLASVRGPDGVRRAIALALLAALAVGWWWLSSPGRVFVFAAAGDTRRPSEDRTVFGVGRFARRRTTAVDPL